MALTTRTSAIQLSSALLLLGTAPAAAEQQLFVSSDSCIACHNGLTSPQGEDLSLGHAWRPSMMANSARDPYWQAGVRREVLDHPQSSAAIQNECSACHMPMARYQAKVAGRKGQVFANLPVGAQTGPQALLAADGVSCSMCHQISDAKLGTRESFVAGFVVDTKRKLGQRRAYGPFAITRGLTRVMRSASGLSPEEARHLKRSEVCATCHTLLTHTLGPKGQVLGTLPEQVPYLEWKHSAYRGERSCQDCHMPAAAGKVPIANVLAEPRQGLAQHSFRGGNFLMPRIFNKHRTELGLRALPQELSLAAQRAESHLSQQAARISVERVQLADGALEATVRVENLTGHKLPTAYPSRRAWLHVTLRGPDGRVLLESGAVEPTGKIRGNDNDDDGKRFEPHYDTVQAADQVQIYEDIMVDAAGSVTTGLLSGLRYVKDNRLLPRGFDKATASDLVKVHGAAAKDASFAAAGDRVTYRAKASGAGPFTVQAELLYQPIGYRWAQNLRDYGQAPEPARFVRYFDAARGATVALLARTSRSFAPPPPPPSSSPAEPPTAE